MCGIQVALIYPNEPNDDVDHTLKNKGWVVMVIKLTIVDLLSR